MGLLPQINRATESVLLTVMKLAHCTPYFCLNFNRVTRDAQPGANYATNCVAHDVSKLTHCTPRFCSNFNRVARDSQPGASTATPLSYLEVEIEPGKCVHLLSTQVQYTVYDIINIILYYIMLYNACTSCPLRYYECLYELR